MLTSLNAVMENSKGKRKVSTPCVNKRQEAAADRKQSGSTRQPAASIASHLAT